MKSLYKLLAAFSVASILSIVPLDTKAETGIGIQFGHPGNAGLSLRFDNLAIGAAWGFGEGGYLHATIDYWMLKKNLSTNLDWFLGPGVDFGVGDPFTLAVRVPIGLQWMATKDIEVFGDVAPGLKLIDKTDFYFAGAIGIRFIL